jgi:hypothetical protein
MVKNRERDREMGRRRWEKKGQVRCWGIEGRRGDGKQELQE